MRWGAASTEQEGGLWGFLLPISPSPQGSQAHMQNSWNNFFFLIYRRGFFFPQLGIQLATVFMHKVPELARVRRGPALPRSPKVLGEITQFIFSGCRMPFPLRSSSLRYLITMFPIHMSGHFTCVRAP